MAEMFKEDPAFAAEYLTQLLRDGEPGDLLAAMHQMALARDGIGASGKQADFNAAELSRTLSEKGNAALRGLATALDALGLRLAVQPKPAA